MDKKKVPLPKSQKQLSQNTIQPYDSRGKAPVQDSNNRANQRSVTDSDVKQLTIGLKEIDEAIIFYFNNVIKPIVVQNGTTIKVPILYGSPERWVSVQKDGYYRDKNGKIQLPLIMYKRDSIEKNRALGNKLDANNPLNYGVFEKKYSRKNAYDRFTTLQNRIPVREFYGVIIPDYVNITYNCILFTEYVEQMNKLIEAINFASDAYWGDKDRFQFRAMIDTYTPTVEIVQGQDRVVKTTFTIKLLGYIIPDTINAAIASPNRYYSKAAVNFKLETAGTVEQLSARAKTAEKESANRFFETPSVNLTTEFINYQGVSPEEGAYISLQTAAVANIIQGQTATYVNRTIETPPPTLTQSQDDFKIFINGILLEKTYWTINQVGVDIAVTFTGLEFELVQEDIIILIGKFR
jgi:hypothetical protein